MNEKARDAQKEEMRKAYDVLRHLKKKIGAEVFNEEYRVVMSELKESLGIGSRKNKKVNALASKNEQNNEEAVNIQENEDDYSDNEEFKQEDGQEDG